MEQHELSKEEYAEYLRVTAEKRAVKEMLEALKTQLATAIILEDKWWRHVAKKYELDNDNNVYKMNHSTMEIIGIPRPGSKQPEKRQPTGESGIRMLERTPEMNELLSPEELAEMERMKAEIIKAREEYENESKSK